MLIRMDISVLIDEKQKKRMLTVGDVNYHVASSYLLFASKKNIYCIYIQCMYVISGQHYVKTKIHKKHCVTMRHSFQEVIFQTEPSVCCLCLSNCLNHPSATDGRRRREEKTTRSRDSWWQSLVSKCITYKTEAPLYLQVVFWKSQENSEYIQSSGP